MYFGRFCGQQWDFQMPSLGMTVDELVGASGLSKDGYLKSIVQPSYWGSEIELYLLSWLLNQTFHVYLDAGNYWQFCRSYGSGKPIMRLLYHDSHYNLIWLKRCTQSTEEAKETSSSENLEEGESNPCEVPRDYGSSQKQEGSAVKSPQPRFHWSENPGEYQEQASRR